MVATTCTEICLSLWNSTFLFSTYLLWVYILPNSSAQGHTMGLFNLQHNAMDMVHSVT